ncbi:MAG: extracellular solute-binding protein, partial [Hungatella sp.]
TEAAVSGEQLADGKEVTLRFAWWGSQNRHERTQKVCEMFEAKYPNVTIEMEPYDFNGYFQKLNTLIGAKDVWDVFQLGNGFAEFDSAILDLQPYIDDKTISTEHITDAFLDITKFAGKQASISLGTNAHCMIYNADMFAEAGLAEPADNWTWDEYQKNAEALKEVTGEFGSSRTEPFYGACTVGVPQWGEELNFFKADNSGLGIDKPDYLVPYMQMIKDMTESGSYPDPGAVAEIGMDPTQDFVATGEAGMVWTASNQFIALSDAAAKNGYPNMKLAPIPRRTADGPAGLRIKSSQGLCASSTYEYPDVAAAFINFFVNDIEANKVLAGERGVPINSAVREALVPQLTTAENQIYDYIDKVSKFEDGKFVNINEPAQQEIVKKRFELDLEKVISGELTPEAAAQDVFDFANAEFAN